MNEKVMQTLFGRTNTLNGVFELKMTKTGRLPFARLAPHQEKALLEAESATGVYHKISDMSSEQKPFDCFRIADTPAYVVVLFYVPRKSKAVYYIRIHDFISLRESSKFKSITEEDAKSICEKEATI